MSISPLDSLGVLASKIIPLAQKAHPALVARAEIAVLGAVPVHRTHLAPSYGSDLGIRSSDDPRAFLVGACAGVGIDAEEAVSAYESRILLDGWTQGSTSEESVAGQLDRVMSFGGLWPAAAEAASALIACDRPVTSVRLATYLGTALASARHPEAGKMFAIAAQMPTASPAERAMSTIRLAAWQAKRADMPQQAAATLRGLRSGLEASVRDRVLSRGDADVLSGVSLNLEALTAVKGRAYDTARDLLREAADRFETSTLVMVGEDQSRRYKAQVQVNMSQLDIQAGQTEEAARRMDRHLAWTRLHHQESLTEAMALTGYVHYRLKEWDVAIGLLHEAEGLIALEGAPSRLELVRKNLAASLFRGHREDEAARVVARIGEDPTGLQSAFFSNSRQPEARSNLDAFASS